jgi:hypothetical protein
VNLNLGATAAALHVGKAAIQYFCIENEDTEDAYVKIYDSNAGVAGMTPAVWRRVPAGGKLPERVTVHLGTGLSIRATRTRANTGDTAAPTADKVSINMQWRVVE